MGKMRFNELSIRDKELLLEDIGVHLCSIEFYDYRIHLYAINNLLIEAYHNIDTKVIERITVAEYGDLDKYVSRITLHHYWEDTRIQARARGFYNQ